MSSVATSFASVIGWRSVTTQTAVPSFSVVVTAAARLSSTKGSGMSPHSLGIGASVTTGRVGCSGVHIESKPSSSTLGARSTTSMESQVRIVLSPMCI